VVEQGRPWSFDSDGYLFRLAFSPEAIYQSLRHRSLRHRRERLEKRCHELELLQRGAAARVMATVIPTLDAEDVEELEEASEHEMEAAAEESLDQATAARTIDELKAETTTFCSLQSVTEIVLSCSEDVYDRTLRWDASVHFP
jgi:hypothetical protein